MGFNNLRKKIEASQAVVGIIGMGYVGLPLAVELGKAGYRIIGFDINEEKVETLNQGQSYIIDVPTESIQKLIDTGKFEATSDFSKLAQVDAISICVPTPLRKTKDPDISYIVNAVAKVEKHFHQDLLIILESTTYPGTTDELLLKLFLDKGFKVGEDFFVCFSPERVDPGNEHFNTINTPKVIGGVTRQCLELGCLLYQKAIETIVPVSSTRVAEMVKLLENTFRAVNIGLVNELAMMCDRMEIDIWEAVNAAATKPFGFMPFYPGPGIGGHCIPLDPQYLAWKAKTYDFYNKFIELASDINGNMPRYTVSKVAEVLNHHKKCINGSRILILGMAYKKNIDDLRESPGLEIHRLLREQGGYVDYVDPYAPQFSDGDKTFKSVDLNYNRLGDYDCIVLCADHSCFDYRQIANNAIVILDTRNAFKGIVKENIFKIGAPVYGKNSLIYNYIDETTRRN